jgi:hypothetical protein
MRGGVWLVSGWLAGCSPCPEQDRISAKYESCDLPVPEDFQYDGNDTECGTSSGRDCLAGCIQDADCSALDESDPQAMQALADCYEACPATTQ